MKVGRHEKDEVGRCVKSQLTVDGRKPDYRYLYSLERWGKAVIARRKREHSSEKTCVLDTLPRLCLDLQGQWCLLTHRREGK